MGFSSAVVYSSKFQDIFVKFDGFLTSQGGPERLYYFTENGKQGFYTFPKTATFRDYVADAEIKIGDIIRLRIEKRSRINGKEYFKLIGIGKY